MVKEKSSFDLHSRAVAHVLVHITLKNTVTNNKIHDWLKGHVTCKILLTTMYLNKRTSKPSQKALCLTPRLQILFFRK